MHAGFGMKANKRNINRRFAGFKSPTHHPGWRQKNPNKQHNRFMEGRRECSGRAGRKWTEMRKSNRRADYSHMAQAPWRVLKEPLTLQLGLLFWKPCKERQRETSTTVRRVRVTQGGGNVNTTHRIKDERTDLWITVRKNPVCWKRIWISNSSFVATYRCIWLSLRAAPWQASVAVLSSLNLRNGEWMRRCF